MSAPVRIRDATVEDATAIRSVHGESITGLGTEAYTERQVQAWAAGCESADYEASIAGDGVFVVAEADETAVESGEVAADVDETVAEFSGAIVGLGSMSFGRAGSYESDADAEITGVYVHPSAAGHGIGTALLGELERRARGRGVGTVVLSASLNAVQFYETRGYERVREYTHEFSAHESTGVEGTVVEMCREL